MLTLPQKYVAYIIVPSPRENKQLIFSTGTPFPAAQEKNIQAFMLQHPESILIKTFIEVGDNPHKHRWPELETAVAYCLDEKAHLIIGEIKNLTNNEAFTKQILRLIDNHPGEIYCCDQPLITKGNFAALVANAKLQKELHGKKIKVGLSRTNAKSGNPHAIEVIAKVNKPKIDNAIIFGFMLHPVILTYQLQNFPQRKMVTKLNEEKFTAPEGGHWVLSQLQKVLDRIKINEAAITLEKQFSEYQAQSLDSSAIANALQTQGKIPPKGKEWTVSQVEKVQERIKQLKDILYFNEFVIKLTPILKRYSIESLTTEHFMEELRQEGINIEKFLSHYHGNLADLIHDIYFHLKATQQRQITFQNNPHYSSYIEKAQRQPGFGQLFQQLLQQENQLLEASEPFLTHAHPHATPEAIKARKPISPS